VPISGIDAGISFFSAESIVVDRNRGITIPMSFDR
jgi:hypothetical protein